MQAERREANSFSRGGQSYSLCPQLYVWSWSATGPRAWEQFWAQQRPAEGFGIHWRCSGQAGASQRFVWPRGPWGASGLRWIHGDANHVSARILWSCCRVTAFWGDGPCSFGIAVGRWRAPWGWGFHPPTYAQSGSSQEQAGGEWCGESVSRPCFSQS